MALRILAGRAGSGKTRFCLEEIVAETKENPLGPPLIVIVPPQATFNMEREIASRGGSMRVHVFSFRRLAYRVLRETGGLTRQPVSELGRRMMLKSILMEHKKELNLMGALHNRPGFLASLSEMISELKICRVKPGDVQGVSDAGDDDSLEMKLHDLGMVYECLAERTDGRVLDPDDYLEVMAAHITESRYFRGCRIWVDGFISFTPQEWIVLRNLLGEAGEMTVTLCLDGEAARGELPGHHPFAKPRETLLRLRRLAGETGAGIKEKFLAPATIPRFRQAAELGYLEENFFCHPPRPYHGSSPSLSVQAAVNPRAEAEGVARHIRRLLRDEGLRLRQIMVAMRDVESYLPLFRRVLDDYEIPFFVDHSRPVVHHPLVELLRSAMEVWQANWLYEPIFRYLKSGLTGLDTDEVDRLENYVLAAGIRGSTWYRERPWDYVPGRRWAEGENVDENSARELDEINVLRRRAVRELRQAQIKVRQRASGKPRRLAGRDWAEILLELCLDLDVYRSLQNWSDAAQRAGKQALAGEHIQVWKLVCGLLEEFVEVLGETELTGQEAAAVLDAGLDALTFSQIPPGPDVVTVGSLERSRPPGDIQALFVVGLTEGALPAPVRSYGVFTEQERERVSRRLTAGGLEGLPATGDRLQREQFLTYRVLTRTGGKLWLSYPLGDNEGRAVMPSPVIRRVRVLFPRLETGFLPVDPPGAEGDAEFAEHPAGLLPRMPLRWQQASRGETVHPLWWKAYNVLLGEERWREKLLLLVDSFSRRNLESPLGKEKGLKIWGRERKKRYHIAGSVSRLEQFIKCPFSHFLAHGLSLEERPVYRLEPPDTGQLYHEVLHKFVEEVSTGPGWDQLKEDDVPEICSRRLENLAQRFHGQILLSSSRFQRRKERLLGRLTESALALTRQIKAGDFRPAALEVYFGPRGRMPEPSAGSGEKAPFWREVFLPPLEVELGDGVYLTLSGRIDRVDLGRGEKGLYLSVIDYKSGREKLDLARVMAGSQMQLLVYLWVALQHFSRLCRSSGKGPEPAGAFYFQVQKPVLNVERPDLQAEELEREWLRQFRLSGWLVDHGREPVKLLDRQLTGSEPSPVIPAALNKDGSVSGRYRASAFTPEEFKVLLRHLESVLQKAGRDIAGGRVDIAPLKMGRDNACRFCKYNPVCGFDPWLPENRYRTLNVQAGELRKRIQEESQREEGSGHAFD